MKNLLFLILASIAITFFSCSKSDTSTDDTDITYADSGKYGANLLDTNTIKFKGNEFSFSAKIPSKGKLTVKLRKTKGGNWYIAAGTEKNWAVSSYDSSTKTQVFTAISVEKTCDLKMEILAGIYILEYYENNATSPSRLKLIEI